MLGQPIYASGECEIDLTRRELRVRGAPAPVGGRAFEIMELLVRSAGELVTKNELMERVWPGAVVLDNTIQVHIAAVRRALGSYKVLLKTESGRGYRLLGTWTTRGSGPERVSASSPPLQRPDEARADNLPVIVTALIGREATVRSVRDLISAYRVVTLTGPAGIGKTTLAIEAARSILGEFKRGGWLAELAPLSDPGLVPSTVAGILGLRLIGARTSSEAVARAIADANLLLILDNCEHVIDAAAELAETIVRFCPYASVLATSREVLRIHGEQVYRVPPLDVPDVRQQDPEHVLRHGAVKLLVFRTGALDAASSPAPDDIPAIAAICRQLDGIPLALEFAAARAAALGFRQVEAGLNDRFRLLTTGRRTALPRHRTLRAALDWSYELLLPEEQRLLRHLAIFPGGFTVEAAQAAVAHDGARDIILDGISSLVTKSLLTVDEAASLPRWRLLETTRVYGLAKLHECGEAADTARRQAQFCLTMFAPFSSQGGVQAAIGSLGTYRREIDNLRAALNWTFSPEGDAVLGLELAAIAADFWVAVSQIAEASEWASKALALMGDETGSRHEMVLQCSLGMALIYTRGMIAPAREALMRALTRAQELADFDYQQRAFHGLWLFSARSMAVHEALAYARQYEELSRDRDPQSKATADWLVGHTLLYLGEHREAAVRLRRAIDQYPVESRDRDMIRFVNDLRASACGHLSASLLSLGLLDAASQVATNAVEEARATNQPIALCIALTWEAGLVFLSLGDLATAERYGEELIDHAYKHALGPFHAAGLCVRGSLAAKRGDPQRGLDPLHRGLAEMQQASYLLFYPFFRAELASALAAMGRVDDGLAEIDEAIRFAKTTDYRWFVPELLRTRGEVLLQQGLHNQSLAEKCFRRATELAREHGALFWELRAALSTARLRVRQKNHAGATHVLQPVYDRFTEGFEAADLQAAKALLNALQ
ncbi:MAG TPA: winged helix-turn-helix domain-containing protein [Acetobacteraceae bacterium]|nr:winged helix-turn-helix domain-containing protein [Acetobacteraceae bacterium]